VFAGGWTYEAAEAVGAGNGIHDYAVLDLLAQLVDKSLVIAEEQCGVVRYRLLETIRQYAHEKLLETGESEGTRDRHLAYYLRLAEETEPMLRGPEARAARDRFEDEHDNLRVALEWAMTTSGEAALRLSGALAWYWWLRGHHDEGRRWLTRALAVMLDPSAARMKALHGAGYLAHHQRDSTAARTLLEESLAIARGLDDRWTIALVLHHLGRVAYFDSDPATARALGQESLAVAEAVGDDWLTAWPLHLLGLAAYISADYATAHAYFARSLAIRRDIGYREGIGILAFLMGLVALREGDLVQARALFWENLTIMQELGGLWNLRMPLAVLSRVAAVQGQAVRAARLAGAVALLGESNRTPLIPLTEALFDEGLDMARQALGETAYTVAWAEGRAMTLDEAIAEALAVEVAPQAEAPATAPDSQGGAPAAGLTATEAQILRLLAGGHTTKEIAGELVVAVSTVDRHITHIYQKLGVRNRAAATALALKRGMV
jgi:non-specific serine/threonine protein kinase